MATAFTPASLFIRFVVALVLVMSTFNPSGISFYHWVLNRGDTSVPLLILVGIAILIGWVVFFRATMRSLGMIGLILVSALFGCLIWLAVDIEVLTLNSPIFIYILLTVFALILALGMSWSHIRRRMSGQLDVDDIDQ